MNAERDSQELLIGGSWRPAASGAQFETTDPVAGGTATVAAAASADDARAAAEAAGEAFASWSRSTPGERRALLAGAADLLAERCERIAATATAETGATFGWGMFNVQLATGMLREAAAQCYSVTGEVIPSDVPGLLAMGIRQPAGAVLGSRRGTRR